MERLKCLWLWILSFWFSHVQRDALYTLVNWSQKMGNQRAPYCQKERTQNWPLGDLGRKSHWWGWHLSPRHREEGENDTSYSFQMFQTVIQTPRFTLSKAGERSRRIKIQQASLQKNEQWQASGQRPLNNGATLQEEEFQWVNAERAQVNINHWDLEECMEIKINPSPTRYFLTIIYL